MIRIRSLLGCIAVLFVSVQLKCSVAINTFPIGPYTGFARSSNEESPLLKHCEKRWRQTKLDHFSWATPLLFSQKYYICHSPSIHTTTEKRNPAALFFYLGNEAPVELYLNNTGLMWELAERFDAVLVFAEHRYYGESKPCFNETTWDIRGRAQKEHLQWLTSEQAMADYAELIWELRQDYFKDPHLPVIGFGGSYGGMLATWFRLKYPHLMAGAIAASAPIWTYYGEDPPADSESFAAIVTRDASEQGGSAPACADNVRKAWKTLFSLGKSGHGRKGISEAMRLCNDSMLESEEDVMGLAEWAMSAWDYMAMGNYPYPSSYILNGDGTLPAFPVRVACGHLSEPDLKGSDLLTALSSAIGVFYNHSQALHCFSTGTGPNNATSEVEDYWSFQFCTEQFMPQSRDGKLDMFFPQAFVRKAAIKECEKQWGVTPDTYKASIEWGGRDITTASNIVFSNGSLDPWSGGGVLKNLSDTLIAVIIPEGAHHLDLMFSNELDPPSVSEARNIEAQYIAKWIDEAAGKGKSVLSQSLSTY